MDIRVEGLRFERDGRLLLDIPSLHLGSGRTTVLVGPNGAGKTTLLRLLASLERPTAGRITHGDGSPRPHPDVAYVFQEQVFLRRRVYDNLELGLRFRHVARAERRERIHEAASRLGITHLLEREADRLSGGEARRVSIARALCLRSPFVLLDEPLAGLDPPTYGRLFDELPGLLDAFAATTIFVTHDSTEARRLADDLVVLIDGRVRAAGEKRDVLLGPLDPAVAEVLGYIVLEAGGRRVAVPRGTLTAGPGPVEFSMLIEERLDLIDQIELVGRIGDTRVHVRARSESPCGAVGERITVHTERTVELR